MKDRTNHQVTHILVVEDDPMFNLFYTRFLSEKGARVSSCLSLAEARNVLQTEGAGIDAIILDNQLTDGDGIELLPELNSSGIRAPVIMVSGNESPEFLLQAFASGIHDYMVKPVSLDLLWLKINNALHQQFLENLSERQQAELEHWIAQEKQEQLLARHLFEHMFSDLNQRHESVSAWLKPHGIFSGDAILRCQGRDGSWYFLLADAMGHGLAPAISLLPVMQDFHAMADKTWSLDTIAFELNALLGRILPDDRFVAAVMIHVIPWQREIRIWNGGMPAVILLDEQRQAIQFARSDNMALGILGSHRMNVRPQVFSLDEVRFFAMYSDGLTDSQTQSGELLNEQHIAQMVQLSDKPTDNIRQLFEQQSVQDDISFCMVDAHRLLQEERSDATLPLSLTGRVQASATFSGKTIIAADLPSRVISFLENQHAPAELRRKVFTVVSELFSNGYEHGILGLDSRIKNEDDGFMQYAAMLAAGAESLTENDQVRLDLCWCPENGTLKLTLQDSGPGFFSSSADVATDTMLAHGRGMTLIHQLADQVEMVAPGNCFHVVMSDRGRGSDAGCIQGSQV